jgi:hypothetical protein
MWRVTVACYPLIGPKGRPEMRMTSGRVLQRLSKLGRAKSAEGRRGIFESIFTAAFSSAVQAGSLWHDMGRGTRVTQSLRLTRRGVWATHCGLRVTDCGPFWEGIRSPDIAMPLRQLGHRRGHLPRRHGMRGNLRGQVRGQTCGSVAGSVESYCQAAESLRWNDLTVRRSSNARA